MSDVSFKARLGVLQVYIAIHGVVWDLGLRISGLGMYFVPLILIFSTPFLYASKYSPIIVCWESWLDHTL